MAEQTATQTIYALFQDVADAERAIGALQDHGIPAADIGVAARRPAEQEEAGRVRTGFTRVTDREDVAQGEPEVTYLARPGTLPPAALATTAAPTTSVDTPMNVDTVGKTGLTTTTPEDAAAGASIGSGIGLVGGLLAAGAAVGGVTGYLRDMGMPEHAVASVHDRLSEGDYLVTVAIDPVRYDQIKQLLLKYNAAGVDINASVAGEQITAVRGSDPVIAEQLRRVTVPEIIPVTPINSVTSLPAGLGLNSRPLGETPDETAAREEAIRAEAGLEERARINEAATRDAIG